MHSLPPERIEAAGTSASGLDGRKESSDAARNRADRATPLDQDFPDELRPTAGSEPPTRAASLGEPPAHLPMREERARARRLLHANALGGTFELVPALLRAEEVPPLLVFAARRRRVALDAHTADGVVRPPAAFLVSRIHSSAPPQDPTAPARLHRCAELSRNGILVLQARRRSASQRGGLADVPFPSWPGNSSAHGEALQDPRSGPQSAPAQEPAPRSARWAWCGAPRWRPAAPATRERGGLRLARATAAPRRAAARRWSGRRETSVPWEG